jgi:hypothetical protein
MKDRERPGFLRLISDKDAADNSFQPHQPSALYDDQQAWQPTLFPELNPRLAVAFDLEGQSKESFVDIIERVRPRAIIDLRVIPRFDYAGFNRRVAFDFFSKIGLLYFDFTGDIGVKEDLDARLNPAFVTEYVYSKVSKLNNLFGPLLFLVGGQSLRQEYLELLAQNLASTESKWQLVKY